MRYLAPIAIILCIVGFLWFSSEISSASIEYISAWDLVGGGFWLFGLGFLIRVTSYAELVRS
ncbi:hypothetical protein AKJ64_01975 [candidate division MSBL1 archaeon SCGC-AAA259E17]|uniref:Uncharacterized protein n=1 Tax=candidate division MSBL1 archaeon SCGC-AAA259E17 TaxID=1698263 RepID=A0A133UF74_9EURY|nr:hypothetical protein AKJ64_01975 [candidate division MSBL1 archaeon SCGC-AAA259E17]